MAWHDGRLTRAAVLSHIGGPCALRLGERVVTLETQAGKSYALDGALKGAE